MKTYPAPPVDQVTLVSDEVTCMGTRKNPDYYTVTIRYVPRERILCTKSLKEWFTSLRGELYSAERLACVVRDVVVEASDPVWAA